MLDLGAKHGGLGRRARDAGLDVEYTGLELSGENVRRAASDGFDVREADLAKPLPVADASYDCVFCLEILEHVTMPLALLEEMRRVLTDGGRAVVSVPSPYSWVEVYRELFGRHDPEGHLSSFTTPVMRNLAALAGFRVARTLGTSIRIPKTMRLISTDSILARSRIYVLRVTDEPDLRRPPALSQSFPHHTAANVPSYENVWCSKVCFFTVRVPCHRLPIFGSTCVNVISEPSWSAKYLLPVVVGWNSAWTNACPFWSDGFPIRIGAPCVSTITSTNGGVAKLTSLQATFFGKRNSSIWSNEMSSTTSA